MRGIGSLRDRFRWPLPPLLWLDLGWAVFALGNLAAMAWMGGWETIPFHLIWASLTLVYGFRVWGLRGTLVVLAAVVVGTLAVLGIDVQAGIQPPDKLTEVPLMSAMFLAMVWHARRRLAAQREMERVSEANLGLLERERRFIQDASHQLRTPITVALGHAELVQRRATDELAADAAMVVGELVRLRRLAEELLLLAAADEPDFLRVERTELEPILVEALRRWRAFPRRWRLNLEPQLEVEVDVSRLALALDALLENAVEHTDRGDVIELGGGRVGEGIAITVRDAGRGIPPEQHERIFERFARGTAHRGAGLGLSIVKTIVEAHRGQVRLRSRPGEGSTFELLLPPPASCGRAGRMAG